MTTDQETSRAVISDFLQRAEKATEGWTDETGLWGDGLGLDSLEAAELSAEFSNGTAGHGTPRIREFTYPLTGALHLVMHSDGLAGRWSLGSYPGLVMQHPGLIAGALFRDHRRGRDDATVVAVALGRAAP